MAVLMVGVLACGDDDPPSSPGPAPDNVSFGGNGADLLPRSAFQPVDSWITSVGAFQWIDDGTTVAGVADTVLIQITPSPAGDGSVASSVTVTGPGPVGWTTPGGTEAVPGVTITPSTVQLSGVALREIGPQQTQLSLNGLLSTPTTQEQ